MGSWKGLEGVVGGKDWVDANENFIYKSYKLY